ncbi:MAG TPA: hypothetical protein VGJ87_21595, partial [Roseiflexaceae bacterium]
MASTIGIISIEQDASFFAERYFREILTVASQIIAGQACYIRLVPLVPNQTATPAAARAFLAAQGVDAALVIAPDLSFLELLEEVFRAMPSIIISAPQLDIPFSYVNSDNYGATRQIVAHLAGLGCRRIRLLQPDEPSGDYLERARGYAAAVAELGLDSLVGEISYPISDAVVQQRVLIDAP